ncbi:MAG TPA: hypothetical protein VK684_12180 [Edaphobacter sp.]|nr:hypothetical protein [Edaphobacter sp.]
MEKKKKKKKKKKKSRPQSSSNGGGKVWLEKAREVVLGGILRDPSLRSG